MGRIPDLPSCIVVLDATVRQWEAEVTRFIGDAVDVKIVTNRKLMKEATKWLAQSQHRQLLIISHSQLLATKNLGNTGSELAHLAHPLFQVKWLSVYVDEIHGFRNQNRPNRILQDFTKNAVVRLGLTATPIPTSLENICWVNLSLHIGDADADVTRRFALATGFVRRGQPSGVDGAFGELQEDVRQVLQPIFPTLFKSSMRRTVTSRDDKGQLLLDLPELETCRINIKLQEHEQEAYKKALPATDTDKKVCTHVP